LAKLAGREARRFPDKSHLAFKREFSKVFRKLLKQVAAEAEEPAEPQRAKARWEGEQLIPRELEFTPQSEASERFREGAQLVLAQEQGASYCQL